jgi:hypothetical protein
MPDPEGKKHHIPDLDPQHCYKKFVFLRVFQKYNLTLNSKMNLKKSFQKVKMLET